MPSFSSSAPYLSKLNDSTWNIKSLIFNPSKTTPSISISSNIPDFYFNYDKVSNTWGHYTYFLTFSDLVSGSLTYFTSSGSSKTIYLYKQNQVNIQLASSLRGSAETISNFDYSKLYIDNGNNVTFDESSNFYKDDSGSSIKLNDSTSALSSSIEQVDSIQNTYTDQMTNSFNQIDTNDSLIKQSKFISSAKWVTSQFDNLVNVQTDDGSKPFSLILFYSLLFGIAMVLIGKIRS